MLDELHRLFTQFRFGIARQFRKPLHVDRNDVKLVETHPLGNKFLSELREPRIANHAIDFRVERIMEFLFRRQFQQRLVWRSIPQKVREFRSEFIGIERFGGRTFTALDQEQELGRREHHHQRVFDALAKVF